MRICRKGQDMKRSIILVMVLLLMGCTQTEKYEEGHSSTIVTSGGEIVSAYVDGEDVTDERKALEEQTKDAISGFLNRGKEELEFSMFCMLEMDGMTIEVVVDEVSYKIGRAHV